MPRTETWRVQALLDTTPFDELPGDLELTTRQAAPYCGVKADTLDRYRGQNKGPAYVTYGDGPRARVYYTVEDIRTWVASYQGVRRDPRAERESNTSEGTDTPARVA